MVLVLIVLVAQWYRSDRRDAERHDRRADRNGDASLATYNQMLEKIADLDRESEVGVSHGRSGELPPVSRGTIRRG